MTTSNNTTKKSAKAQKGTIKKKPIIDLSKLSSVGTTGKFDFSDN